MRQTDESGDAVAAAGEAGGSGGDDNRSSVGEMDDPFDPERLRKAYANSAVVGVKRAIIRVPVKKPEKYWFVRTHSDPSWWLETGTLELKEEREFYLIAPELYYFLRPYGAAKRVLIPSITRQGVLFIWPIRLPDEDGRLDSWNESALEIARLAVDEWVSPCSNRESGCYDLIRATAEIDTPRWPDLSLHEILKLAFKDRRIDSEDHPVVRRILGKA